AGLSAAGPSPSGSSCRRSRSSGDAATQSRLPLLAVPPGYAWSGPPCRCRQGCMIGDGPCHAGGDISVICVKGQERHDCTVEVLDVLGLGLLVASGVAFLLLGEPLCGSLGVEFGENSVDGVGKSQTLDRGDEDQRSW